MNRSAFETSWGAIMKGDSAARFRLWAPAKHEVSLIAVERGIEMPMRPTGEGWFDIETAEVAVGDGYCFRFADGTTVPDPAARSQVGDVHGPSRLVNPNAYQWRCATWPGRPWEEAVIYELHVGTFAPAGTFDGVIGKLEHLQRVGVTAIELRPVGQFAGARGWGYDGVLPYAPHTTYGGPEGLKRLVDRAHERNLMVLLDVVYNHLGPVGNYLPLYAPTFFDPRKQTPWGPSIAWDRPPVRQFFLENALYWLEEFKIDGLRLDAASHLGDGVLLELACAVRQRITGRQVHLCLEDSRNQVRLYQRDANSRPRHFTAGWNDDVHHAAHVLATSETDGYYGDYPRPAPMLARALAEGYAYQGERSTYRGGDGRGERSAGLPPSAFIDFLQNHDQIGNRPLGERLPTLDPSTTDVLTALLLLSPHIPLLFMGQEWGERRPFYFFTDFTGELGASIAELRCEEFKGWRGFAEAAALGTIPHPNAPSTFAASALDWRVPEEPAHARQLAFTASLLDIRARDIVPRLGGMCGNSGAFEMLGERAFHISWWLGDGTRLTALANFGEVPVRCPHITAQRGAGLLYASSENLRTRVGGGELPERSLLFLLEDHIPWMKASTD
jgi:maltooligosyltrehalose trehalohydrolase